MLGLNLKLGDRDPATVAYRRGASGYDALLPDVFDIGLTDLADDLQARLEAARAGRI